MKMIKSFPFLLLFWNLSFAQTEHIPADVTLPDHPRLLMLKGEEAKLKTTIQNDPTWIKFQDVLLKECDRLITVPPVERIQIGRRLLDKSREALRRLFFLSYAFRMTNDQKYFDRAEKEMLAISAFSDWNPTHFLDVAEMTMAAAIGYDWLYHNLSPQSRTRIKEAIIKKGLEPSLESRYNGWLRAEHNWNQVCNAGMTYGAIAVYEDNPQLARQIINRAIESIVIPMKDYAPDGAYPEGYGYWGYGTSFNVMFISAVEKLFGKDFGLSTQPGFLSTPAYLQNMTGPSGNPFNYGDAGSGGGLQPAMFWFASKLKDPALLWIEKSRLANDASARYVNNRLLPGVILWSAGVGIDAVTAPKSTMYVGKGKMPVALMRTSWNDPSAIYLAIKGGSASVNHAHMDVGSFVMEADGVRWAMDFGMQDYESLESKGIRLFGRTQDAERWNVFRYNNFVHNTLTVNNKHQLVAGYAPITRTSSNANHMYAVTDISEVYKGYLNKAVRGAAIVDQKYVVVRDEIETPAGETTVRWTMLTPATVKITGKNTAELTKDGKKLFLRVEEPANITMKTWSTDPPNSYDAPNPGTALVGFELTAPANSKTAITVALVPEKASKQSNKKVQPLDKW